jgi:hypothetical protein
VEILDEHDRRLVGGEPLEERDSGVMEPFADVDRACFG